MKEPLVTITLEEYNSLKEKAKREMFRSKFSYEQFQMFSHKLLKVTLFDTGALR